MCGSSYAFGTLGALEGASALATGNLVRLSEQNIIDCSGMCAYIIMCTVEPLYCGHHCTGPRKCVLIREVSLLICTQTIGTSETVLISEVSFKRGSTVYAACSSSFSACLELPTGNQARKNDQNQARKQARKNQARKQARKNQARKQARKNQARKQARKNQARKQEERIKLESKLERKKESIKVC